MKKKISFLILCTILLLSTLSHAEAASNNAVFDDFILTVEKVSFRGGKLTVKLSQVFQDIEIAKQYQEFAPDGKFSLEELDAQYRSFALAIITNRALHIRYLAQTSEASAKAYEDATSDRFMQLMASFKTPEGEPFFPDGSFESWEFGSNSEPKKQSGGTWLREISLTTTGFTTDQKELVMEFYVFDPHGDDPYTGEVQQTLHIKLP